MATKDARQGQQVRAAVIITCTRSGCGHPLAAHHGDLGAGRCMMQLGTYGLGGPCPCTGGLG